MIITYLYTLAMLLSRGLISRGRPAMLASSSSLARRRLSSAVSAAQRPQIATGDITISPELLSWEAFTELDQAPPTKEPAMPNVEIDPATQRALLGTVFGSAGSSTSRAGTSGRSLREQEIASLLQNKVVKGVGPKLASSLLSKFGERTLDVLRGDGSSDDQQSLLGIPGLGEKKLATIRSSVEEWEGLLTALAFGRRLWAPFSPTPSWRSSSRSTGRTQRRLYAPTRTRCLATSRRSPSSSSTH